MFHWGSFLLGVAVTMALPMIYYLIVTVIERKREERIREEFPTVSESYWADKEESLDDEIEHVRVIHRKDD